MTALDLPATTRAAGPGPASTSGPASGSATGSAPTPGAGAAPRRAVTSDAGAWRRLATFLAFPPAGLLAVETVGAADTPPRALLAGAVAGLVIGAVEALVLRRGLRWALMTAAGLAAGLAAGVALTGGGTGPGDLAILGLLSGAGIGTARRAAGGTWRAVAVLAAAWPLGWLTTWAIGVDVERGYAVPGASGALVIALISLALLRTDGGR